MDTIDMAAIGERIRTRRKELNISQQEAHLKLGISQNHYSRIENGHAGMSLDLLLEISSYLSISTDYILKGQYTNELNPLAIEKLNQLPLLEKKHIERYINLFMDYVESAPKYHPPKQ